MKYELYTYDKNITISCNALTIRINVLFEKWRKNIIDFIIYILQSFYYPLKSFINDNHFWDNLPDYRFIVMADSRGNDEGINEEIFRNILGEIIDIYPQLDYIIFPGDLVSGSRKPENLRAQLQKFKDVFSDYYPIEILLPTVGNHEVSSEPEDDTREKIFAEVFSEFKADEFLEGYNRTAFYVDIGNIRLIVLNSYHPGESNEITGQQFE